MPAPERYCFCPYIDGPEICGNSVSHRYECRCKLKNQNGRNDCPIIQKRGDL